MLKKAARIWRPSVGTPWTWARPQCRAATPEIGSALSAAPSPNSRDPRPKQRPEVETHLSIEQITTNYFSS